MAAAGGGLIAVIGIAGTVIFAMLFVSGIGVIMVKSWGRTLSIVSGVGPDAWNRAGSTAWRTSIVLPAVPTAKW